MPPNVPGGSGESTGHGDTEDIHSRAVHAAQQAVAAARDGDPRRVLALAQLGLAHYQRSETAFAVPGDHDQAVASAEAAVAACDRADVDVFVGVSQLLAEALAARWDSPSRHPEDVNRGIDATQHTLDATPADHPALPALLGNLTKRLANRWSTADGQPDDLTRAIDAAQQAVDSTPAEDPALPKRLTVLAALLAERADNPDRRSDDLFRTIEAAEQALAMLPIGHPDGSTLLDTLATSLSQRWASPDRQPDDLGRALACAEQAVNTTPVAHPHLPGRLSNLGNQLAARWDSPDRRPHDLSRAVEITEQAIASVPDGAADPRWLNGLANLLAARSASPDRQPGDLSRSIEMAERAAATTRDGHPDLPVLLNNLANQLAARWASPEREPDDLSRAIDAAEQAVATAVEDHPTFAGELGNLAVHLAERWASPARRPHDLTRAIELTERALAATPLGDPDLPSRLQQNLASQLAERWSTPDRQADDLRRAVDAAERAVAATRLGDPDLPSRLSNLANHLATRWATPDGQPDDLSRAVDAIGSAVTATSAGAPDLPGLLNNLAIHLATRWKSPEGQPDDPARAVDAAERAVTATAAGDPDLPGLLGTLASALVTRWASPHGRADDFSRSGNATKQAVELTPVGHPDRPARLFNLARRVAGGAWSVPADALLTEAVTSARGLYPLAGLRAASCLAGLAARAGEWERAVWAAAAGLNEARGLVVRVGVLGEDWLGEVQGLAGVGAYGLCRLSDPAGAVALLERGVGVLVGERLETARTRLADADAAGFGALVDAFRRAAAGVEGAVAAAHDDPGPLASEALGAALAALAAARDELEAAAGPLAPEASLAEVMDLASTGRPLVHLVAGPTGGAALVSTPSGVEVVWLDDVTEDAVASWTDRLAASTAEGETRAARSGSGGVPAGGTVGEVLSELCAALAPLTASLSVSAVLVVPVGALAGLPVPAALMPLPVSVAASARLHSAAAIAAAEHRAGGMLAVTDPAPCTGPGGPLRRLPGASVEGALLQDCYQALHVTNAEATRARVVDLLAARHWTVLHVGAHGLVDRDRPARSRTLLADGPDGTAESLTASDLDGRAGAIVLACCNLSATGRALPDEAQGFPTSLLAVGARFVLAPLWPVSDDATTTLVEGFYGYWLDDGHDPATALTHAVADTRNAHRGDPTWAAWTLHGS